MRWGGGKAATNSPVLKWEIVVGAILMVSDSMLIGRDPGYYLAISSRQDNIVL